MSKQRFGLRRSRGLEATAPARARRTGEFVPNPVGAHCQLSDRTSEPGDLKKPKGKASGAHKNCGSEQDHETSPHGLAIRAFGDGVGFFFGRLLIHHLTTSAFCTMAQSFDAVLSVMDDDKGPG